MTTTLGRALILALLTLVLGALGGYHYSEAKADAAAAKVAANLAAERADAAQALAAANAKARKQEQDFAQKVKDLSDKFSRENADARAEDASTIADLRSGAQRMRLQVAKCSAGGAGSSKADGAARGSNAAATAELAPATAEALWSIASDGDTAIRKLNVLQPWVENALKVCNGATP